MPLTLADANRIIAAAIGRAQELDLAISVAVCNGEGRLIALNRMDGAFVASVQASMGKAVAATTTGRPSGEVDASFFLGGASLPTASALGEGMPLLNVRGGLPIMLGGGCHGACGVSGAKTDAGDEDCARAGIAALGGGPGR